ncbi:MAG: ribonuclease III [Anaerolineae bacterium]|nr:ribonuclease III [Anaerolineae bacterium]
MADEAKVEVNTSTRCEEPDELIRRLSLPVKDNLLLARALTHRSYLNENPEALEDNERLEFLGDAVLDFVVGAWLYHRYPEMPEGDLTRMRSALVYTEQLASFARMLGLGNAMRLGRGEAQSGGRSRDALLCDTFEAIIGAIYIDSGIDSVIKFIEPMLAGIADDILANHKIEDPKSLFQEWAQAHLGFTPQYITRNASGPDHSKVFEVDVVVGGQVYGSGTGHSKQAATKSAALNAIERYNIQS